MGVRSMASGRRQVILFNRMAKVGLRNRHDSKGSKE